VEPSIEVDADGRLILVVASAAAFETWLADEHESSSGVWVRLTKKGSPYRGPTYDEALDVALCFGWIDSQSRSYDAESWLQRFTPRRPRSGWSRRNIDKVAGLVESGRMRPAGQREVDAARSDGRWDAALEA
jgi:uncharacterized protein YdeI (YjbR/CyaY-like superfamily)